MLQQTNRLQAFAIDACWLEVQLWYQAAFWSCYAFHNSPKALVVNSIPVFDILGIAKVECSQWGVVFNHLKELLSESASVNVVVSESETNDLGVFLNRIG